MQFQRLITFIKKHTCTCDIIWKNEKASAVMVGISLLYIPESAYFNSPLSITWGDAYCTPHSNCVLTS